MAVHLFEHNITFVTVPKCACSSAKLSFFQLENGRRFRPFRINGRRFGIHDFIKSEAYEDLPHKRIARHKKIALVRSPVKRLRSCYEDKVLTERSLERKNVGARLKTAGLKSLPSFEEFVTKLEAYQSAFPVIQQHTRPLDYFMGENPNWYDRIFSFDQIQDMVRWVTDRTGIDLKMRHTNKNKTRIDDAQVTPELEAKINDIYASDYKNYGQWLSLTEKAA